MDIEIVAVTGVCIAERRAYARRLAAGMGAGLVPASRIAAVADPVDHARGLAGSRGDRVVVELPTHTDPHDVVAAFQDPYRLAAMVCLVDAVHLLDDIAAVDDAVPGRSVRAVEQIEAASAVVLVNWEVIPTEELATLMALVAHLAPVARLRLAQPGSLEADVLAGGPPFRPLLDGAVQDRAGWIRLLNGEHEPAMTDARVSAFRYEQLRPVHPERLQRVLDDRIEPGGFGTLIRSSGFVRFATRPATPARWDHVGSTILFHPTPMDALTAPPGQDLALIGLDLDHVGLAEALDGAALTDAELEEGPLAWRGMRDPFPVWRRATTRGD